MNAIFAIPGSYPLGSAMTRHVTVGVPDTADRDRPVRLIAADLVPGCGSEECGQPPCGGGPDDGNGLNRERGVVNTGLAEPKAVAGWIVVAEQVGTGCRVGGPAGVFPEVLNEGGLGISVEFLPVGVAAARFVLPGVRA